MAGGPAGEGVAGMKTRYQFIYFVKQEGKQVWSCRNNRMRDELGVVQFYANWRQWVFMPTGPAVYSAGCLADLQHFIGQLGPP